MTTKLKPLSDQLVADIRAAMRTPPPDATSLEAELDAAVAGLSTTNRLILARLCDLAASEGHRGYSVVARKYEAATGQEIPTVLVWHFALKTLRIPSAGPSRRKARAIGGGR